jgi:hypothetical protein
MRGLFTTAALLAAASCATSARAADLPAGATVLDDDIIWDIANPHAFALSRDGQQIAYISHGALWLSNTDAGPPKKLADLPNTITEILARPGNEEQRDRSAASPHSLGAQHFIGPRYLDKHYVISLAWTPDQHGLTYTVRKRIRENTPVAAYHVMHASLTGEVTEIAVIEREFGVPDEYTTSFHVTKDRKFVIASAYAPLIWDVAANRPRVTPYDVLIPSSTSGRYLGIEIDTRQLVVVDEQFQIAERFEQTFPAERTVDIIWSADERFAVARTRESYERNTSSAILIDLETARAASLGSCNYRDRFLFTGRESELLHLRIAAASVWGYTDGELGTAIRVYTDFGQKKRGLFMTKSIRKPDRLRDGAIFPPMIAAPNGNYIAAAVPRPEGHPPGAHYHLVTRAGQSSPLFPLTEDWYITPYYPIAFTEDRLIARSGSTLFSLPIAKIAQEQKDRE